VAQAARVGGALALAAAVAGSAGAGAAEWTVRTYTGGFEPDTLRVAVGDTVTWVNLAPARHLLVFAGDPTGAGRAEVQEGLDRSPLAMTVRAPGRYRYHCPIHAMYAVLVVAPAPGAGP
jgi:plastocyanin